jgi:hypothetical protein
VDALGLIIAVVVTAASVTDNTIGTNLLDKVIEHTPTVTRAYVDAGFKDDVMIHGAVHGSPSSKSNAATPAPGSYRSPTGGNDLATTRTTVTRLTATCDLPTPDGPLDNTAYQQILAAFQRPATAQCAPRTSATRSASAPNPRTPKASVPS